MLGFEGVLRKIISILGMRREGLTLKITFGCVPSFSTWRYRKPTVVSELVDDLEGEKKTATWMGMYSLFSPRMGMAFDPTTNYLAALN
jgi:hypothetical protein